MLSSSFYVAPKGKYVVVVSTNVETSKPADECLSGLRLLGNFTILEQFEFVSDFCVPSEDGSKSGIYISTSYDATNHFETTCCDVADIYQRVTGGELDLTLANDE